jgi:hypothetical protein
MANWRSIQELLKELTYLLTPWSRVLPEKLKRPELLKKFPAFYGTRRFITAFTRACHLSLSWARLIQSMPPHATSRKSILILSSQILMTLEFSWHIFVKSLNIKFHQNPSSVSQAVPHWKTDMMKLIVIFAILQTRLQRPYEKLFSWRIYVTSNEAQYK